jgi:predicted ATPase
MQATAETIGDPDLLLIAHRIACISHFWQGDVTQSCAHGDRVLARYDEAKHRYIADCINLDPKTSAGVFVALGTWMLGYPDRAVQVLQANAAHARRRGHPFDLGWMLTMGSYVWDLRREPEHALAWVEEAERLGRAHSLPFISDVLAPVWKGVAWLRAGRLAEGLAQLRAAMDTYHAHGGELVMPYYRAVLAEGLAVSGESGSGLRLIEESLTQIGQPGWEERCYLAEILRLKGWMLTRQKQCNVPGSTCQEAEQEAEECFLKSLAVARAQQAKSWELRASTSLSRLWQQQGKQQESHHLLSAIYGWFTEGFDTKDLQEAKALIEELSH